jgi:hypothetical protein
MKDFEDFLSENSEAFTDMPRLNQTIENMVRHYFSSNGAERIGALISGITAISVDHSVSLLRRYHEWMMQADE